MSSRGDENTPDDVTVAAGFRELAQDLLSEPDPEPAPEHGAVEDGES
ncbi:hypothetical protein [Streptomyces iconiensis]|uniref:Uncharacterized protein n=1 Tax=Streptomyces iconiensis TaxID=1384038 RepID=A0ABT6ZTQ1_9ACTN|nr:hypothetical protein [Streptomyces iconiensis]MDJ1132436.1 hypothetical protein [Streptomyces iconiensis]